MKKRREMIQNKWMLVLCILAWNTRAKEKIEDTGGDYNCESEIMYIYNDW